MLSVVTSLLDLVGLLLLVVAVALWLWPWSAAGAVGAAGAALILVSLLIDRRQSPKRSAR